MGGGRRRECERYPASHVTRSLVKCRTTGWVKQVGGEILPLAVLRVNFSNSVTPPGTPLLDDTDRVVTIGFQSSGGGNIGYALHAKSKIPRISRVLPDSSAAAAGVQPNEMLRGIGSR